MTKKAMDRRTLRTRATLHQALMSLVIRRDYEAITVKDIIDEANVGRSTFYAHYTSKEDLLRGGFDSLRALLIEHQRAALAKQRSAKERSLGFSLAMFEHARDHKDIYRALVGGRGGAVMLNRIRQLLSDLVRDELAADLNKGAVDAAHREMIIQFVVGAFMAVLTWWLDRKARLPPSQIDAMFRRLTFHGIMSASPS